MARHIHIHLGRKATADAWNESDHPRADNGQFGSGGGGKKAAPSPAPKQGGSAPIDTSKPEGRRLASGLLRQATSAPAPAAKKPSDGREDFAKGLEHAEQQVAELRKLKPSQPVQTPEGRGHWAGLDRHGRALVNMNGRVVAFHPTKVKPTGEPQPGSPAARAQSAERNLLASFLASENAKAKK